MLDNIAVRSFSSSQLPLANEAAANSGSSGLSSQRSDALGSIAHPLQAAAQGRLELPEQAPLAHRASVDLNVAQHALQQLPREPVAEAQVPRDNQFSAIHPKVGQVHINNTALPAGLDGQALQDTKAEVQRKIDRGSALVDQILSGQIPDRPCTQQDVSDIMWALHTQAESKAGMNWHEGAICIEDPNGRLRGFLDSNREAYQRDSTHVSGFQTLEQGKPRGINFDGGGSGDNLANVLPNNRGTLLYQAMGVQDGPKVSGMPKNMLFLKMEQYGAYSGSLNQDKHKASGPTREQNAHDSTHYRGHIKTTIQSIWRRITGNNSPVGSCKERIPSGIQKAYGKLSSSHIFGSSLPKEIRSILKQDNPTSSAGGIRIMHRNINEAIKTLEADPTHNPKDVQALKDFLANKIQSNPRLTDNIDCRIGEEIILTSAELSGHPEAPTGTYAQAIAEKEIRHIQIAAEKELRNTQAIAAKEIKNASNLDDAVRAYNKAPSLENAMTIMYNFCQNKETNSVYADFRALTLDRSLHENGLSDGSIADGIAAKYTPEKLKDLFKPLSHLKDHFEKLHLPENQERYNMGLAVATAGRFPEAIRFLRDAAAYQDHDMSKNGLQSIYNEYIQKNATSEINIKAANFNRIESYLLNFNNTNPEDIKSALKSAMGEAIGDCINNMLNAVSIPA